ncbi:tail tube protein [Caulobacter phage Cr30]|uniref:tail tube protein n=1 Tax=Caulobacter phage Cr30 TaxID=1357714 RepID=UPI0004A9BB91|nr:tail tube protein [Caulobacter phage Cr30]AGS81071.1 tail tube protein [Caulobacter phage Cr30]
MFNINELRANLSLDGARPSQFIVEIQNPFNSSATLKTPFLVEATSIPGRNLGRASAFYFGREIKFGGDSTYDDWGVQIINDEDFILRNAMEEWASSINSPEGNIRREPGLTYKSSAIVSQLSKTGDIIRRYRFQGIFPVNISDIALAWSAQNQIERFSVTFSVDEWIPLDGVGGPI